MIISVVNQKGGVAKTTTTINLAAALGELDKKVLVIDLDPQGNATSGFGIKKSTLEYTTYDVIMENSTAKDAIKSTSFKKVDIIPATQGLAECEARIAKTDKQVFQLKSAIDVIRDEYDYILIDCLPSLGSIALSGLACSEALIIPMQCEPYSLEGVAELMNTIKKIKSLGNNSLMILGIVFTMIDKRLTINRNIMDKIKQKFPPYVIFETEIPRNVKIAEAPNAGIPIIYYDSSSKGAEAYRLLAKEFLQKCEALISATATVGGGA